MAAPNGLGSIAVPSAPLTPDQYKNYALQDPGFLGLQSALQGNEDAFQANARGGINKGVIALGVAPSDPSLSSWIDPATAQAAAANPLSTTAGLNTQHQQNVRGIQNQLAARGGYDSGELTYGLGNENTRDTQARANALSSFMDYANGLFSQLGTMKAQDAQQLGTELGAAAMRQLALHPGQTTTANWDDQTGTYVDQSGNHYDQYGNPITSVSSGGQATNFGPPTANPTAPPLPATPGFNQGGFVSPTNYTNLGLTYGGILAPQNTNVTDQPVVTRGSAPQTFRGQ